MLEAEAVKELHEDLLEEIARYLSLMSSAPSPTPGPIFCRTACGHTVEKTTGTAETPRESKLIELLHFHTRFQPVSIQCSNGNLFRKLPVRVLFPQERQKHLRAKCAPPLGWLAAHVTPVTKKPKAQIAGFD